MYVKLENPKGQRMQNLFINGEKVELDRTYEAVFVTVQGVPPKYGKEREDLDIRAIDALKSYVETHINQLERLFVEHLHLSKSFYTQKNKLIKRVDR